MKISPPTRVLPMRCRALAAAVALVLSPAAWTQGTDPADEYYIVKAGDTLSLIARRFGLDYRTLAQWNGIDNPALIRISQRLRLTDPGGATDARAPRAASAARQPAPPAAGNESTATVNATTDASDAAQAELSRLRVTTGELIRLLLEQGLITRDKAAEMMRQAQLGELPPMPEAVAGEDAQAPATDEPTTQRARRRTAEAAADAEPGVVRVPYVPEVVKNEIRDQVREEVIAQARAERWAEPNSLPEWLDRITWEGDLRLRYEGNFYGGDNLPAPIYNAITGSELGTTTEDEHRFRYRARLGMLAKLSEQWGAGFRFTSGNTNNPVSTNQSLGSYFNRGLLTLDRVYLRWDPSERWSVAGGRIANPYIGTDLLWDEDLTFEGFAGSYKPLWGSWRGLFTAGAYLVEHQSSSDATPNPKNKYLLGLQAGAEWEQSSQAKLRGALAYYSYHNIHGRPNTVFDSQANDWTAPAFRQKGNSLFNIDNDGDPTTNLYALASKFEVVNLTLAADLAYFEPYTVRGVIDYAKNIGFDRKEIRNRTGLDLSPQTTAYKLGLTFGKQALRNFGDWQAFASYRYLERDAVLDAFTDSDFHLGGTDTKGYELGGSFALDRNVWLRLRWLSADEIDGPPLAIDVLQLDLNARF